MFGEAGNTDGFTVSGSRVLLSGDPSAQDCVIQPIGRGEADFPQTEAAEIARLTGRKDFLLASFEVNDWNSDLTPWEADAVFGNRGFGRGAENTLDFICGRVMPELGGRRFFLAGYSLAGLFALWAAYNTDAFAGAAGVSPSVWYPGWLEYARARKVCAQKVYLSLGNREEKTRNPVMARVGNAIREQYELLTVSKKLDWNEGNHFVDADKRLAKGVSWLISD